MSDGMNDGSDDDVLVGHSIMEKFLAYLQKPQTNLKVRLPHDILPKHLDPNLGCNVGLEIEYQKKLEKFVESLVKKNENSWIAVLTEIAKNTNYKHMLYQFVAVSPFKGKLVGFTKVTPHNGDVTLCFPGFQKAALDPLEAYRAEFVVINKPKDVSLLQNPFK